MAWITPTTDDVLSEFTPAEAQAISAAQGYQNLQAILTRAVNKARGAIAAGGGALDVDPTKLPLFLGADVVAIARWRVLISIPELPELQTKERKAAHDDGLKTLADIAAQKLSVDSADGSARLPGKWGSSAKVIMRTDIPSP